MSTADISRKEKYSRCVALEEDYVHQVYEQIGKNLAQAKDPLEATVKKFLDELEPGSLVADIGCGDGRHMRNKNGIFSLGADSSCLQASLAHQRCQEAILGNNMRLPFRGNAFDAALSVGVIHHFTTKERRIKALKELSRILKIGGKVLIAVQRHNAQISKDVLIPWFDVPKDKKMKDKQWFDQDSGEYELDDDRDADQDEDEDDEDSISLPSSDEEDTPWTNNAKFFPPQTYHAKRGWNSERQSRSLDYDYQTSSNNVPNSKQLVQTNACYAFVRKALKRFSSVNTSQEDPYFTTDLYQRADSAVPPSPASGQEQKFDLLNCSSFDHIELLQKTISDNFIELLNIDDEQDTSSFLPRKDCTQKTLCESDSKNDSTVTNKRNLIRSLSGMFKNVNSLWSSKGTKSCSDLKSQATSNEIQVRSKKERDRRLVRSKTTATCHPEFDYFNPLENIEEFDMTVNEANKIINDFLESSTPSVETVKSANNMQKKGLITPLTHSDIVNGNTLPFYRDSEDTLMSKDRKIGKLQEISAPYSFSESRANYLISKHDSDHYSEEMNNADAVEDLVSDDSKLQLFTFGEKCSKYNTVCNPNTGKEYTGEKTCQVIFGNEDISFKADEFRDKLSEKTCIEHTEKTRKCEIPPIDFNGFRETQKMSPKISKISEREDFVTNEKDDPSKDLNDDTLQVEDGSTNYKCHVIDIANQNNLLFKNDVSASHSDSEWKNNTENVSSLTSSEFLEMNSQDQVWGINQTFHPNVNYKCLLQNSPKRFRKSNQNHNSQMAVSKTLGPFYDEDSDDICMEEGSRLSSYYSMPELHALTEFYQEYTIYQSYIINNTSWELSKTQDIHSPQNVDNYTSGRIPKTEIKTANHLQESNNDNIAQKNSENRMFQNSFSSDFFMKNLKTDLCDSMQSAFTYTHSSEEKYKIDDKSSPINAVVHRNSTNDFPIIPFASLNKNLPLQLNNSNKCKSLISINSNSSCGDNLNDSRQFCKMTRSHSIDSIHKYLNAAKCMEIHRMSSLSSSQTSLIFTRENNNKSNQNLFKQSQKNICYLASSFSFADEAERKNSPAQICAVKARRDSDTKCKKRAFSETSQDFENSASKSPIIEDNCFHSPSFVKVIDIHESNKSANKTKEQSSNSYYRILSEVEYPFEQFERMHVRTKDSGEQEFDADDQVVSENVRPSLRSKRVVGRKISDPVTIKERSSSTLFSEPQHWATIPSRESACERRQEFKVISGFPKFPVGNSNHPKTAVKMLCDSDSISLKRYKGNISDEHSTGKKLKHFSPDNISRNEPIISSFHQLELVCSDNKTNNGAITNKKLPVKEKLKNESPSDSNNSLATVVSSMPSYSIDSKRSDLSQTLQKTENSIFSDSNNLCEEKFNHAYGRIHEEGAIVIGHRYHHLFEEQELDDLIENNISDLHVLNSFHEDSYWCVVAEKVRVWTI